MEIFQGYYIPKYFDDTQSNNYLLELIRNKIKNNVLRDRLCWLVSSGYRQRPCKNIACADCLLCSKIQRASRKTEEEKERDYHRGKIFRRYVKYIMKGDKSIEKNTVSN